MKNPITIQQNNRESVLHLTMIPQSRQKSNPNLFSFQRKVSRPVFPAQAASEESASELVSASDEEELSGLLSGRNSLVALKIVLVA